jgi:hypothetical protein
MVQQNALVVVVEILPLFIVVCFLGFIVNTAGSVSCGIVNWEMSVSHRD